MNVSTSVLALLVAFVSVVTAMIPVLSKYVFYRGSRVEVGRPTFDATTMRFVASNEGYAPASIEFVRLESPFLEGPVRIHATGSGTIIPTGSIQFSYEIVPMLSEEQAYEQSLNAMNNILYNKNSDESAGKVLISIFQSNGSREVHIYPILSSQIIEFLRADSDRCNAIKEPSFVNGCIGTGEPDQGRTPVRSSPKLN